VKTVSGLDFEATTNSGSQGRADGVPVSDTAEIEDIERIGQFGILFHIENRNNKHPGRLELRNLLCR
jgi:hypothetical protein